MDYPDSFQTVEATTELRHRCYEIEIDMTVAQALRDKARQRGVSTSDLATEILRQQLSYMPEVRSERSFGRAGAVPSG